MRKVGYGHLAVALAFLLLATLVFLPSGAGPRALDREKAFIGGLHNSLYHLDLAKSRWAEENHKSEHDVPTMADLVPYLGDWTNAIERFMALGITYKITPISETNSQSDVATLTRDLRFRIGICRFYPAGTSYCLQTGWAGPQSGSASWFLPFYHNNRGLLAALLFMLGMGSLLAFVIRKILELRREERGRCRAVEKGAGREG